MRQVLKLVPALCGALIAYRAFTRQFSSVDYFFCGVIFSILAIASAIQALTGEP